jgi:uncharacterized protein (DUF58 family)
MAYLVQTVDEPLQKPVSSGAESLPKAVHFPFWRRVKAPPAPQIAAPEPFKPAGRALPEQLLRKLEFTVLKRLDGFFFGDYSGVFYGPSLDLAEVRQYQPGDEVRRIDWNVTARSGDLHVRQYREEREITAWIIVDSSVSMHFGTRRVTKYQLATEFAALTARICTRHGDKVGALVVGGAGVKPIPAGSGRQQALRIVDELLKYGTNQNSTPNHLGVALEQVAKSLRRRGLVFVVSDFLEPPEHWQPNLTRLGLRHDLVCVRTIDPVERELPKVGGARFRDPTTGQETWLDTSDKSVQAAHQKMVLERENRIQKAFRRATVDSLELVTANEIVNPLLKFAIRRRGRR